jgi:hypothetical protein
MHTVTFVLGAPWKASVKVSLRQLIGPGVNASNLRGGYTLVTLLRAVTP